MDQCTKERERGRASKRERARESERESERERDRARESGWLGDLSEVSVVILLIILILVVVRIPPLLGRRDAAQVRASGWWNACMAGSVVLRQG